MDWSAAAWIGICQFAYVLPLILSYRRRQKPAIVKGLILATVLTVLVNWVGCSTIRIDF